MLFAMPLSAVFLRFRRSFSPADISSHRIYGAVLPMFTPVRRRFFRALFSLLRHARSIFRRFRLYAPDRLPSLCLLLMLRAASPAVYATPFRRCHTQPPCPPAAAAPLMPLRQKLLKISSLICSLLPCFFAFSASRRLPPTPDADY